MNNAEWLEAVNALQRVAFDPEETPYRKRIAERALRETMAGSGPMAAQRMTKTPEGHQTRGNHRGGSALRDDMLYDGFTD